MPDVTTLTASSEATTRKRPPRIAGRWMVSFIGFPIGGLFASLLVGPIDDLPTALIGGLVTGLVLGAAQSWAMGRMRPPSRQWVAATAIGLMLGLAGGSALVGFRTDLNSLLVQGAITGLGVGAAQAVILRHRVGRLPLVLSVPALSTAWALGWLVTTSAGIAVEEHFTTFGASGALVVTGLTAVLPLALTAASDRAS